MERNLSSPVTFFWKFVFPIFWIGFASVATYTAWFHPERWQNGGSLGERWGTTAMLLVGSAVLVPHAARLCRVRLNEDGLTISNYWRQMHVPFAAIADVEFRPMKGPPRVTLTFRSSTPLGRRVIFIPYADSIDVLVSDLRTRAGLLIPVHPRR
jgi:hypothetical protein